MGARPYIEEPFSASRAQKQLCVPCEGEVFRRFASSTPQQFLSVHGPSPAAHSVTLFAELLDRRGTFASPATLRVLSVTVTAPPIAARGEASSRGVTGDCELGALPHITAEMSFVQE